MKERGKNVQFGDFKTVFTGNIFSIKRRDVIYPNGELETHEYCERFDSVTVLAFDNNDKLLLTREFRVAKEKYIWFLPTGKIDPGEKPLEAAQREMQEEIGKRAKIMKPLFSGPASSSYFLWDIHVFVAKDLIDDPLEPEEKFPIELRPTSLEKAVEMAMDGTIDNQFLSYYIIRLDYMLRTGKFKW